MIEQGSEEWQALRAGKFTASRFSDLMAKLKDGRPAQARENLIWELVVERMTGQKMQSFQSQWMERGILLESDARLAYENEMLVSVDEVPIVIHPTLDYVSCSPDGYVGDTGLLEIKCLTAANHGKALKFGTHAKEYALQVQGQMWITGRAWCDVVAYHPEFPERFRLAAVRVNRDENTIAELEAECIAANDEVNEQLRWFEQRAA
jgi:putative phage-type endonuclease